MGDTATQGAHSKESQCGLGWAERASLIVECGSPGNPKGVHQSGSGAAEATGTPQERGDASRSGGGKCWRDGARVRGGKGEGETGKEETIANGVGCVVGGWGERVECFPSSPSTPSAFRARASAIGVRQPTGGPHV